jgi:hypothetical protein
MTKSSEREAHLARYVQVIDPKDVHVDLTAVRPLTKKDIELLPQHLREQVFAKTGVSMAVDAFVETANLTANDAVEFIFSEHSVAEYCKPPLRAEYLGAFFI